MSQQDYSAAPYREVCGAKGEIGSGETLCRAIYPAWSITTVSVAANTYCMTDSNNNNIHEYLAPSLPGSNLAVPINMAVDDWPEHTAGGHLFSAVQAATNTDRL